MGNRRGLSEAVLTALSFIASSMACLATPDVSVPCHQAPKDARLLTVPVFEPGKSAWVSVYDQLGRAIPNVSVFVDGVPIDTDQMGQASFTVPRGKNVRLHMRTSDNKDIEINDYTLTPAGYLTTQADVATALDQLEGSVESTETSPMIAYAPAAIETSQPFVVIGKNLTGKAEADRIIVDGYDADVFAGSTASLLATAPKRLSLGPLRELYVTAHDETSNLMEIDICHAEFVYSPASGEQSETATLRVIGSNVPTLLEGRNTTPEVCQLEFQGRQLGTAFTFVTPGGDNNKIGLGIKCQGKGTPTVETHLCSDAPWGSADDRAVFADPNFRKILATLNKAQIIRLKRRLIAVESRLNDERCNRGSLMKQGGIKATELDKLNAQMRTLSSRLSRINAMISSRRAVFQSLGGTDNEYRQALDEAAGGTAISLEKDLAPVTTAALLASSNASPNEDATTDTLTIYSDKDLQAKEKELAQSFEELKRVWKKFPNKQAPAGRLAAPPEPYIPNLGQFLAPKSASYTQYAGMHVPPPPPILLQLKRGNKNSHGSRHHSTNAAHRASVHHIKSHASRRAKH